MRHALALLLALAAAQPALAITWGEADGEAHPQVGALVAQGSDGQYYAYCSGTLIAPTVFLTAAHCDLGRARVELSFATRIDNAAPRHAGSYHGHPGYAQTQNDPHDIAVVVLDAPVAGVAPALLPPAGFFDSLKASGGLNPASLFTAVGYGGQERNFDGQGGPVIAYQDARERAVSRFNAMNPAWLRLSQNRATGDGGTCYGDSGGPNFYGAGSLETRMLAGTTITGDAQCVSTNVIYRLDTPSARAFLKDFVSLP